MKPIPPQRFLLVVLAAGVLAGCGKQAAVDSSAASPAAPAAEVKPANQSAPAAFAKLTGKWQRADGDYIIEIRSVEPGGKLEAAYFNPRPIHVATAQASQNGQTLTVLIELRDLNYPGSTYRLSYDPQTDRLAGTYFQAVAGETYEVLFVRAKP